MEKRDISDQELIKAADEWNDKLIETGGRAWKLVLPAKVIKDNPDLVFDELARRFEENLRRQPIRLNDREGNQLHEFDIVGWSGLDDVKYLAVIRLLPSIEFHLLEGGKIIDYTMLQRMPIFNFDLQVLGSALYPEHLAEDIREEYFEFCDLCNELIPRVMCQKKEYKDNVNIGIDNSFIEKRCEKFGAYECGCRFQG